MEDHSTTQSQTTPGGDTLFDQPLVDRSVASVSHSAENSTDAITETEIFDVQQKWASAVIETGKLFSNDGDYVSYAHDLVETLYGYAEGAVLFKPTLAIKHPFREKQVEAISYFVGGVVNEDLGFAIRPWQHIRFATQHVLLQGSTAIAMGQYFFRELNTTEEVLAEFTFGYFKTKNGKIKINVHHSSLPYSVP